MSVFGVDFGGQTAVIALARRGGIDVCTNEVSNRATPCIVSFGMGLEDEERFIGEAGLNQCNRFPKNSVVGVKRFLGRTYAQVKASGDLEHVAAPGTIVELPNGRCGFKMMYNGEQKIFDDVSIMAMLLKNFADTAAKENNGVRIKDFVISCPPYFTAVQRQAILDASHVAGLNCLRVMTDSAAVALQYGLPRATEFSEDEKEATNVVIYDMGHTDIVVTVASYTKGALTIRSTDSLPNVGGRDFDLALFNHFVEEFKTKHKFDTRENAKAVNKLKIACEKMRKVLSANHEASFGLECFMNDIDVRGAMTRDDFTAMVMPLLNQALEPLKKALAEAKLKPEDIHHTEIAGGATRMPGVQSRLAEYMGKEVMKTLNLSECISRGAAFMAAMLSPAFRVRDFAVSDTTCFPIRIDWEDGKADDDDKNMVLFNRFDAIPKTRQVTFKAPKDLTIRASYADPATVEEGTKLELGTYKVDAAADPEAQVRVKFRVDHNGIFTVTGAQSIVEYEEEVEVEDDKPADGDKDKDATMKDGDKKDGDAPAAEGDKMETEEAPKKTKLVKKLRKDDLGVRQDPVQPLGLSPEDLNIHAEDEGKMAGQDKLVRDTAERKNAVESYVYEMRNKVEGALKPFLEASQAADFIKLCNDTENWLYEDGDGAKKQVYVDKLAELEKYGAPALRRADQAQRRPTTVKILQSTLDKFRNFVASTDEKYAHIPAEERAKVSKEVDETAQWLTEMEAAQAIKATWDEPAFSSDEVMAKQKLLQATCGKIMDTPPPPPPKEEEAPAAAADGAKEGEDKKGESEQPEPAKEEAKMDLD